MRVVVPIDHNPLVIPILQLLQAQSAPISEHALITLLRPQLDQLPGIASAGQLALFRTHFLVMNALYQLQRELLSEGFYLCVSPLAIVLEAKAVTDSKAVGEAGDKALSDYYLDLNNLAETSAADVAQLLSQFWQRYMAADGWQQALAVLVLGPEADWPQIRTRYRQLAARLHPDRGGDAREFMRVREAFECLRHQFEK